MRGCEECFSSSTWVANASPADFSPGTCDFGHGYNQKTWSTTAWVDSMGQLLSLYELADDHAEGDLLGVQIQRDWGIFDLEEGEAGRFLCSAVGDDHEMAAPGARVRLRSVTQDAGSAGLTSWSAFSEEIRCRNRYFPQATPDRQALSEMLLEHVVGLKTDVSMYRARAVEEDVHVSRSFLQAPPPSRATGGRANPTGIPYLYLAFSVETCIYESRVANHARIAVGEFRPVRELRVLDLADIDPPEFFSVEDLGSIEVQARRVSSYRYLVALGDELKRPVRATDQAIEYIPTQYLCEFAKSLELDGVLYPSSQHRDGRNVVLFDVSAAQMVSDLVQIATVTGVCASWVMSDQG